MNKIPLLNSYHNFADKRQIFGIRNGMNVLSNVFIFAPAMYLLQVRKRKDTKSDVLSVHISALAFASAYYHLRPTRSRIFWDILLIATTHVVILSYFISDTMAKTMYCVAIVSVLYGISMMI